MSCLNSSGVLKSGALGARSLSALSMWFKIRLAVCASAGAAGPAKTRDLSPAAHRSFTRFLNSAANGLTSGSRSAAKGSRAKDASPSGKAWPPCRWTARTKPKPMRDSADGRIGMRTSALLPVRLMPPSIAYIRFMTPAEEAGRRMDAKPAMAETVSPRVPRKSASSATMVCALSKRYWGSLVSPNNSRWACRS